MKNGMRLGKLKDDIMIEEPSTFSEVMAMATKLIKMDEDRRFRREDDKTPIKNEDRLESRRPRPTPLLQKLGGRPNHQIQKRDQKLHTLKCSKIKGPNVNQSKQSGYTCAKETES